MSSYESKFRVFGPYSNGSKEGRKLVIVIDQNGKRRSVSFPKWVMECFLGRQLDPDKDTVDHINSDLNDNRIENLRLMPRSDHSREDTRRVRPVKLTCAWCGKEFERSPRLVRDKAKAGKAGPFHSRQCAGAYSRALQLKLVDKFDTQKAVDSVYYKKKYEPQTEKKAFVTFASAIDNDKLIEFMIDHFCEVYE